MIGKPYEYEAMAACESELWWYKNLHDITLSTLKEFKVSPKAAILDAGCGTGGLLKILGKNGYKNIDGFDLSEDALKLARASTGLNLIKCNIISASDSYKGQLFDVIISHDILCLLPAGDDIKAIHQLLNMLKPGGLLLINLPASKYYRGTHDLAVGIQTRYTKKLVEHLAQDFGIIEKTFYWPLILSIPIFFIRLIQRVTIKAGTNYLSDVKMPNKMLNNLFYFISKKERERLKVRPWGSSIFSVIRKSELM